MNKLAIVVLLLLAATAAAQGSHPCSKGGTKPNCREVIFHVASLNVEGTSYKLSGYVKGKGRVAYEAICESEQRDAPCVPVEAGGSYRAFMDVLEDKNGQPISVLGFSDVKYTFSMYTITSQHEVEK